MIKKEISSRILTVAPHYIKTLGGISQVVSVYSNMYEEFNVVASTRDGSLIDRFIQTISGLYTFFRFILSKNIKIVHIHGATKGSFWRKAIFIYLSKIFNKKVIYHIHGANYKTFFYKHPKTITKVIQKCDLIICLSESWKSFFEEVTHPKRCIVLNNIIPLPTLFPDHHIPQKECNFLFLGRLGKRKGVYDLLEVLRDHKTYYKGRIKLFLGGDGEIEQVQKCIKEYGLEEIVKYIGWITGEKKIELLNKSDVYILPSYSEGLPISILEAMSYKLPIISTNVGGIPEVVFNDQNGYLITPGDQPALKICIDKVLISETLRKKMGENSYTLSQKHFPYEIEQKLTTIYTELLKK
ncbi:hypothetical protein HMPREF1071_03062 [Bacteroides salyersiae CL02T12C01]|uniref:Glycosyl transferase family 1 domain-containing protein n=1 Tax=Bacteroides salyersiae CL02T12C01 TaxID=997887 RepID=I9SXP9_9BACE|nr:glycosyltransferase family 4 protein [Bacteroides salyersiae]EIY61191.1 hypothetical protein HMPREF1071_03062 [Bacteroides salyersiae CL02T12C01]QUT76282.1 N-acetyl-alpha-D-glucosaminyl L-malate synthase [Bacteroides salyersiae]